MSLLAPNRRALANRFPEALALLETAVPVSAPSPPRAEESVAFFDEAAGYRRILLVLTDLPECATTAATLARAPRETIFWCLEPEPGPLAARLATEDLSAWLADRRVIQSIPVVGPKHAHSRRSPVDSVYGTHVLFRRSCCCLTSRR